MKLLYLLLGSNLGNRRLNIDLAIKYIAEEIGPVCIASSCYETEPWGLSDQGLYLNTALAIECNEEPFCVLERILSIEKKLGRMRTGLPNEARIIDIDILFYGNLEVSTGTLMIPHPRVHLRKFALVPLNEIAPGLVHPTFGLPVSQLLNECADDLSVGLFKEVVIQS